MSSYKMGINGRTHGGEEYVQAVSAIDATIDTKSICENEDDNEDDTGQQSFLRRNALLVLVAIGVAIGFGLGFGLRSSDLSVDAIMWLGLPGEMFMNMLKMTIIPLIAGSIISGTATTDPKSNGRISMLSISFIVTANLFGAVMGILAYLILSSGSDITSTHVHSSSSPDSQHLQSQDMFADLLRNILPENLITTTFQKAQTRYTSKLTVVDNNGTNVTVQVFVRHVGVANSTNILGVILISAVVGLAAGTVKEASTSFVPFFRTTSNIFIRIMRWFVWSTPIGVASMICVSVLRVENLEETFRSLGMFLLTFTLGNLIQQLLLVPAIYFLVVRKNPFSFLLSTARPCMTVFGPPSSVVGMPDVITVCEETHHVDTRVSNFAIPFGVTLCRAESCYFISLSALFMISMTGRHPDISEIILIGILTTLGSLALPSVPSGSIVTIIIVLSSLSIDTTSVGVLMALEWYTSSEEPFERKQHGNRSCLRRNILLVLVAVGVVVGFCLGFGLRSADLSTDAVMWLALPGKMFMRMLMLTIIPLISSSIIIGTANTDRKSSGRVGALALGFLVLSNFLGAILGIIVYFIFTPGNDMVYISTNSQVTISSKHLQTQDMIADFIRNVVPDNIVSACFQKTQTRYIADPALTNNTNATIIGYTREVGFVNGINFLGVIMVSAVVGLAAGTVEESSISFVPFFRATSDIFIKIMQWFIWSTPVGVASLISVSIVQVESIENTFRSLGMFILYYTIGILVQQFVLIPVVYFVIIRKNPFKFLLSAIRPWMATFGTASSALAMPEMINTCENMNKSDVKVCRFVVPLGVAICRPGSVYFIVMSSLFIANLTGVGHSAADVLMIGLLTIVSSLSIPSIPSASIVIIIIVLESINVDTTAVGLLLALEWYTDRIRGASNALHVVTCVMVVEKFCTRRSNDKKSDRTSSIV